jgi:hypothetical protein
LFDEDESSYNSPEVILERSLSLAEIIIHNRDYICHVNLNLHRAAASAAIISAAFVAASRFVILLSKKKPEKTKLH